MWLRHLLSSAKPLIPPAKHGLDVGDPERVQVERRTGAGGFGHSSTVSDEQPLVLLPLVNVIREEIERHIHGTGNVAFGE